MIGTSAAIPVTVHADLPEVTWVQPGAYATLHAGMALPLVIASKRNGKITGVNFYLDQDLQTSIASGSANGPSPANFTGTWSAPATLAGQHMLTAIATDTEG